MRTRNFGHPPNGLFIGVYSAAQSNKFVHIALQCTLSLALEVKGVATLKEALAGGLDVAIVGDNDFYSQRARVSPLNPEHDAIMSDWAFEFQLELLNLSRTLSSLSKVPRFCHTNVHLPDVHKTGLGSSAALITSLVSALLIHFSIISREGFSEIHGEGRRLAHNLAQYVHCLAQGKVGSGFDVSSAVFGSQLYTRFAPTVLQGLMNDEKVGTSLSTINFLPHSE